MLRLNEYIEKEEKVNEPSEIFEELENDGSFLQVEKVMHPKINPTNPPNVLLMRRVSIRQFPNGTYVALYYIDSLNQYITVPFNTVMSGQ